MMKIDGKSIEIMNFNYWLDDFKRKAEKQIENQKVAELVAEGIDKQLARDMVKCGLV